MQDQDNEFNRGEILDIVIPTIKDYVFNMYIRININYILKNTFFFVLYIIKS